jgi:hypothetical protein
VTPSPTVIGLGARCELIPEAESTNSPGSVSFSVVEFEDRSDGSRVVLRSDRGFAVTGPVRPTADDPLAGMTAAELRGHVLATVAPDGPAAQQPYVLELGTQLLSILRLLGRSVEV